MLVFVDKAMSSNLCVVYGCFCIVTAQVSSGDRDSMSPEPEKFTIWPSTGKKKKNPTIVNT